MQKEEVRDFRISVEAARPGASPVKRRLQGQEVALRLGEKPPPDETNKNRE